MVEQLQCQSGVGVARILLGIPYCVLQNLLPQKQRSHGAEHFPYWLADWLECMHEIISVGSGVASGHVNTLPHVALNSKSSEVFISDSTAIPEVHNFGSR